MDFRFLAESDQRTTYLLWRVISFIMYIVLVAVLAWTYQGTRNIHSRPVKLLHDWDSVALAASRRIIHRGTSNVMFFIIACHSTPIG